MADHAVLSGNPAAATVELAIQGVLEESPRSIDLLNMCAFLAPEGISRRLFLERREAIADLPVIVSETSTLNDSIGTLSAYGLIRTTGASVSMHRRVQEACLARLSEVDRHHWGIVTGRLVAAALPQRPEDFRLWSWCSGLVPHALAVRDHLVDQPHAISIVVTIVDRLAAYFVAIGRFDEAQDILQEEIARHRQSDLAEDSVDPTLSSRLGGVLTELGEITEAAGLLEAALENHRQIPGPATPQVADDLFRLAKLQLAASGLLAEEAPGGLDRARAAGETAPDHARQFAQQALAIHRATLGDDAEEVAGDLGVLAEIEFSAENLSRGLDYWRAATATLARTWGHDHPVIRMTELFTNELDRGLKTGEFGSEAFREYKAFAEQTFGSGHYEVAAACQGIAEEVATADPERASAELRQAIPIFERVYGSAHYRTAAAQFFLFAVEGLRDDLDAASSSFRSACEFLASQRPDEAAAAIVRSRLTDALRLIEQTARERELLDLAVDVLSDVCGSQHPGHIPLLLRLASMAHLDYTRLSGNADLQRQSLDRAEELIQRAQAVAPGRRQAGDLFMTRAGIIESRAEFLDLQDRQVEAGAARATALELRLHAFDAYVEVYGTNSLAVATAAFSLLAPLIRLRRFDDAAKFGRAALGIFEHKLGVEHPRLVEIRGMAVWANLAVQAALAMGDTALGEGNTVEARQRYFAARENASETVSLDDDAESLIRLAFLDCVEGEVDRASAAFSAAVSLWRESGLPWPQWRLVHECAELSRRFGAPDALRNTIAPHVVPTISGGDMTMVRGSLGAGLPEGWFWKERITILAPDSQANIILSTEPLDSSIDSEQYARIQGESLAAGCPGFDEYSFESTTVFSDRAGYGRHFTWTPEGLEPITQLQLYYAENGRGYTATATTPTTSFPASESVLRAILESLIVGTKKSKGSTPGTSTARKRAAGVRRAASDANDGVADAARSARPRAAKTARAPSAGEKATPTRAKKSARATTTTAKPAAKKTAPPAARKR